MFELPADGKSLVDLDGLAGLNALSAKNTLAGIVAIEGIGHIHFIWFWLEGTLLVLNIQCQGSVVDPAIFIVVVADSAVEHMIAQNDVEGFGTGGLGLF